VKRMCDQEGELGGDAKTNLKGKAGKKGTLDALGGKDGFRHIRYWGVRSGRG